MYGLICQFHHTQNAFNQQRLLMLEFSSLKIILNLCFVKRILFYLKILQVKQNHDETS